MKKLLAATLFATIAAFALPAAAAETVVPTKTFDVYVDLPTGFTFVKMPGGWKFVGQVGADEVARLPAGVITALVESDDVEWRVATAAAPATTR